MRQRDKKGCSLNEYADDEGTIEYRKKSGQAYDADVLVAIFWPCVIRTNAKIVASHAFNGQMFYGEEIK